MRTSAAASRMVAASLAATLALSACGPRDSMDDDTLMQDTATGVVSDMIRIDNIEMGTEIGADMKVVDAKDEFAPKDTIYVSVATQGTAQNATLMLMVTSLADSVTVVSDNKTVSPMGPTVTEFHFSKPDGLKVGEYKAEVYLNGALAETKEFEIKTM